MLEPPAVERALRAECVEPQDLKVVVEVPAAPRGQSGPPRGSGSPGTSRSRERRRKRGAAGLRASQATRSRRSAGPPVDGRERASGCRHAVREGVRAACPISTGCGTRRVHLVRGCVGGEGGVREGGVGNQHACALLLKKKSIFSLACAQGDRGGRCWVRTAQLVSLKKGQRSARCFARNPSSICVAAQPFRWSRLRPDASTAGMAARSTADLRRRP